VKPHFARAALAATLSLFLTSPAWSQDAAAAEPAASEALEPVVVLGNAEHLFWANYRSIYAGLREVHKLQAKLAPHTEFRFVVARASGEANPAGKRIRVLLMGVQGEIEVTRDGGAPFEFPLDERLAEAGADIAISGAGPQPVLRILAKSANLPPHQARLGDARLVCGFLTAARKAAATGMNRFTLALFGTYTCNLPVGVSAKGFEVFIQRKDGKEDALPSKDGIYYFPTHLSSYADDAILEVRPRATSDVQNAP